MISRFLLSLAVSLLLGCQSPASKSVGPILEVTPTKQGMPKDVLRLPKTVSLDGVYAKPASRINDKGEEEQVGSFSYEILEMRNGQFRYWYITDFGDPEKYPYPYTGAYTKQGNIITLQHYKWQKKPKRYVTMTINGIIWLWTEEGLKKWKTEKEVMYPAVLVRFGDGPVKTKKDFVGRDLPSFSRGIISPSIKPLLDMKAVQADSSNKKQKNGKKQNKTLHTKH